MTRSHVAIQFDDAGQQRLSATLGMWTFLATEVLFFGGLLAGYAVYRGWYPAVWSEAGNHLDVVLGTVNTAVLLTSSLSVALAVDAARRGAAKSLQAALAATIALGLIFLAIKGYEYLHKWNEHLVPGTAFRWPGTAAHAGPGELYFSFYFVLTGAHALHMLIGIGLLAHLWRQASQRHFSPEWHTPVVNVGLYWHFVDIVWVFLFPLLYLID